MNYDILLSVLFELLRNRRTTAATLSKKHAVSQRTVYRYVDKLSPFLPLHVRRGRGGGIYLADSYRLPVEFLTEEEYRAALDALLLAYQETAEERFLLAKRKLCEEEKHAPSPRVLFPLEEVLFLSSKRTGLLDKLQILQTGIREKRALRILHENSPTEYEIEPLLLFLKEDEWYLYAFCPSQKGFFPFPLNDLRGVSLTETFFLPRDFDKSEILTLF